MPRADPRGSRSPPPAGRSATGPSLMRSSRAAHESSRADGGVPGCAERPRRATLGVRNPTRVSGRPVRSDRNTSSRDERAVPWRPRASKSALRRSIGKQARYAPSFASDREPLAPLCASAGKHAPTALRSHAGPEAVFALPCALLGLVGPLHRARLSSFSGGRFDSRNTRRAGSTPASRKSRLRLVSLCAAILPHQSRGVSNSVWMRGPRGVPRQPVIDVPAPVVQQHASAFPCGAGTNPGCARAPRNTPPQASVVQPRPWRLVGVLAQVAVVRPTRQVVWREEAPGGHPSRTPRP